MSGNYSSRKRTATPAQKAAAEERRERFRVSRYVELRPRGRRWLVVLMIDGKSVASRNVRTKPLAWLAAELLVQRADYSWHNGTK